MLDVDFKVWVTGENLPTKHLKGELGLGWQRFARTRAKLKTSKDVTAAFDPKLPSFVTSVDVPDRKRIFNCRGLA